MIWVLLSLAAFVGTVVRVSLLLLNKRSGFSHHEESALRLANPDSCRCGMLPVGPRARYTSYSPSGEQEGWRHTVERCQPMREAL